MPPKATTRKREPKSLCMCCGLSLASSTVSRHEAAMRTRQALELAAPLPLNFPFNNLPSSPIVESPVRERTPLSPLRPAELATLDPNGHIQAYLSRRLKRSREEAEQEASIYGGDGEDGQQAGPSNWWVGDRTNDEVGHRPGAEEQDKVGGGQMEQDKGGNDEDNLNGDNGDEDEDDDGSWLDTDAENDYDIPTPTSLRSTSSSSSDESALARNMARWSDSEPDDEENSASNRLPPPPPIDASIVADAGCARKLSCPLIILQY